MLDKLWISYNNKKNLKKTTFLRSHGKIKILAKNGFNLSTDLVRLVHNMSGDLIFGNFGGFFHCGCVEVLKGE